MDDHEPSGRLRSLLRDDEELRWWSKPDRAAWYAGHVVGLPLGFGIVGLLVGVPSAGIAYLSGSLPAVDPGTAVLAVLGAGAALVAVSAALAHLLYRHQELGLTDDRLIKLGGLVGRDASTVSLEDVRDVDIRVVPMDRLFGTARVRFKVAGGARAGVWMSYVDEPYEVLDLLEDARGGADRPTGRTTGPPAG